MQTQLIIYSLGFRYFECMYNFKTQNSKKPNKKATPNGSRLIFIYSTLLIILQTLQLQFLLLVLRFLLQWQLHWLGQQ